MNKQYLARGAAVLAMLLAAAATGYGLYAMFAGCTDACGSVGTPSSMPASTQLPLLTITGVLALLVALALVAVAFALLDLSDKTEALGLPAGSIRAVLALALVLIFAILTIFLYSDMAAPPKKDLSSITGLTAAQAKALSSTVKVVYEQPEQNSIDLKVAPKAAPANTKAGTTKPATAEKADPKADPKSEPTYTVYFREPRNPAAEDFAKQVLVLIGTLVTSVTSFYFGSKAAAASTPGIDAAKPTSKLTTVTPTTLPRKGPVSLKIAGSNLQLVNAVKLIQGTNQVTADTVTSNANLVDCKFNLNTESHPAGEWDIVVTDSNGQVATLAAGVTLS